MAKFLNKKEQVVDFKLTPYGKYLLSIGTFKPTYYALFDDNILYDGEYAGLNENQNTAHERIKEGTPYLESLVLFENVELPGNYIEEGEPSAQFSADTLAQYGDFSTAQQAYADAIAQGATTADLETNNINPAAFFQKGSFATVLDLPRKDSLKFTSMIGDAYLDGETQAAPSWKIVALQGDIEESTQKDMENDLDIPQVNIELNYAKKVVPYNIDTNPTNVRDINDRVSTFLNDEMIQLVMDDALIYADEVNTQLLTENFEIDVFEIVEEFPGAVASSSIMYNYCADNSLTITENNTLSINDGLNNVTFVFKDGSTSVATDVDISDADLVLQNLQSAINNSTAEVSASLGSADSAGCYSSLIVSKLQVGRIGGASAQAFGGKSTTITTNETTGVTLANAQTIGTPSAATANLFINAADDADKTITLVSTDGTSKTYTAKDTESLADNHFLRAPDTTTASLEQSATSLKACIEGTAGHNGKITVVQSTVVAQQSYPRLRLTQATAGPDGNKSITSNMDANIPSTFTGGDSGPSQTILRGGMDKRVTFIRKYFEKETPQVVNGMLQSPTPIVNSPQSYTTSSVEYYFDILVDSEIEQRVACKSAEAFNKQSYYIDLDFDCEETEQDFVYADIYGRVTDPEICQT